jgi:serine phosphatase RsbU (regulator of sigma subunit)
MTTTEPPDDWSVHLAGRMTRQVAEGDAVFRTGDAADGAYVVLAGSLVVVEDGDVVGTLSPGELFGEIASLGGGERTADVVAVVDTELLFLSLDQLHDGLLDSPEFFWQSLRLIVTRLKAVMARQIEYRDEHKALREVQRSLLPDLSDGDRDARGFGVEAVWRPCTYASGDYYDLVRLDEHRHLIALGDVMGHGAEASLMMAIARAQLRELARTFRRTDELLLRLDGYLRDNAPPKQGMSLVVAVYDRRERLLEYCIAGHPAPLLWRDGEFVELPGRTGILLALPFLIGTGYERREIVLQPGDRMLFFTDGLFEIPIDDRGGQLGPSGFADLVADAFASADGDDVLDSIVDRLVELDVGPVADDDRTAVLMTID